MVLEAPLRWANAFGCFVSNAASARWSLLSEAGSPGTISGLWSEGGAGVLGLQWLLGSLAGSR